MPLPDPPPPPPPLLRLPGAEAEALTAPEPLPEALALPLGVGGAPVAESAREGLALGVPVAPLPPPPPPLLPLGAAVALGRSGEAVAGGVAVGEDVPCGAPPVAVRGGDALPVPRGDAEMEAAEVGEPVPRAPLPEGVPQAVP